MGVQIAKQVNYILSYIDNFLGGNNGLSVFAEEVIIQQEELSFEKCLKVIATSHDKLSIAPKFNESDQKRVAVFTLADGTLTISCDGIEGNVTVTTNVD